MLLFRIAEGKSSLDIINAEFIQSFGNGNLLLEGETNAFGLHSIT